MSASPTSDGTCSPRTWTSPIGRRAGQAARRVGSVTDRIVGNTDDDILIAGTTAFDNNDEALCVIMAEGTSARDYATRTANLRGTGTGPRNNGTTFLVVDGAGVTVFDDGARDVLTGGAGRDWFFAQLDTGVRDCITDLSCGEFASDLDFSNS